MQTIEKGITGVDENDSISFWRTVFITAFN
jgi:hypothetical protein